MNRVTPDEIVITSLGIAQPPSPIKISIAPSEEVLILKQASSVLVYKPPFPTTTALLPSIKVKCISRWLHVRTCCFTSLVCIHTITRSCFVEMCEALRACKRRQMFGLVRILSNDIAARSQSIHTLSLCATCLTSTNLPEEVQEPLLRVPLEVSTTVASIILFSNRPKS